MEPLKPGTKQSPAMRQILSPEAVGLGAEALRGLVLTMVERLVNRQTPLLLDLAQHRESLAILARMRMRPIPLRRGRSWWSFPLPGKFARIFYRRGGKGREGRPPHPDLWVFKAYTKLNIKRDRGFFRWRGSFLDHLMLRLGGHRGTLAAHLTAAADAAWLSPNFQRKVAELLCGYLKRTYLIPSGGIPIPEFSNRTFWLLLALGEVEPLGAIRRLQPQLRAARRILTVLRPLACSRGLASGWAGFWDQWLIVEAVLLRGRPLQGTVPLEAAVAALPLMLRQHPLPVRQATAEKSGTRRLFLKTKRWLAFLKSRLFPQLAEPPAPVGLTVPDWRTTIPAWYEFHHRAPARTAATDSKRR